MIGRILQSFSRSDALGPRSGYDASVVALGHIALGAFVPGALWSAGVSLSWAVAITLGLAAINEARQWRGARRLSPAQRLRLARDTARDLGFYAVGVAGLTWAPPDPIFVAIFAAGAAGMLLEFAANERLHKWRQDEPR